MSHPTQLQPGYILHQRPYRDTSLLLEVFTRDHGRLGLVARGARGPRGRNRGLLQPFQPLLLSWSGRGELGTLTGIETAGAARHLPGAVLYSGFYLNELLLRLLQRLDPHPALHAAYAQALVALPDATPRALRLFEKTLLEELGYGLLLDHEAHSGAPVEPGAWYIYELESGPARTVQHSPNRLVLAGSSLLSLAADELHDTQSLSDAKRLLRAALGLYLGGRELKTREVFAAIVTPGSRS
ncbi:MAG: DNA repair protein RecO [Thiohalobacteraceae bacterium]|nr:DNA repair protein RecO [Gammaproteobacteria bacterium]